MCTLHQIVLGDQIKEDEMGGHIARMRRYTSQILPKIWEEVAAWDIRDNIKMEFK
jgi:hypothetical protein